MSGEDEISTDMRSADADRPKNRTGVPESIAAGDAIRIAGGDPNCTDALKSMYLFLDKEQLTAQDRAHVKEHLDGCIPCLESFEFEAELKQVIKKKCQDDLPSELYEKVRLSLKAEIKHQIQQSPPVAE